MHPGSIPGEASTVRALAAPSVAGRQRCAARGRPELMEVGILKDSDRQFFRPLWRRVAVTILCAVWSAFELSNGETLWGGLAGAAAAYAAWNFFVVWDADKKAG